MLRITVQEYSRLRRFKRSDEIDREGKSNFIATNVYRRLNQVTFDGNDLGNSGGWADIDHINNFMNQAIGNNGNQLAYYIGPIGFGFGTEEAIKDSLKHICKRKTTDDSIINDHYGNELDKPFIFIVNTETVLDNDPIGIGKTEGGSHWISWVLLPKEYTSLSGEETKNDKYQVLFFDSYAKASIPEGLKKGLTNGMTFVEDQTSVTLLPLCKENEIVFHDNNKLTGQQMNSNDCGWWASYYALMTVYTGKMQFLEQLKGKKLSGKPLRSVMNLQESTEQSSVQQQRTSSTQQENQQSLSDDSQSDRGNQPIDSAQHHQINQSPDSTDYDDEVTPEEELINTIKSHDSEEKKVEKIKKLFENELKPNIDFQNTGNGDTPLHIAVRKKELLVIESLRRNKAKIDIKNNRGKTSLDIAQSLKRQDIVQVLKTGYIDSNVQALIKDRRKSIDNRELLIAAAKDDKEKVECPIEEEVNVDFVDKEGNTALHYAVYVGNFSIVQLLLNKVKNANIVNNKGETPLDIAKRLNRRDIIQILEEQQFPVRVELSVQQQSQQKRTRADSERNRSEDSNTKKLRTSSSDHQHMEASQDSSRKRIHSQGDRESSVVLEAELNIATSFNHQSMEVGNISGREKARFQSNQEGVGALNIRQSTSVLDKPNKYAASGLKNSLHGCIYQLKLLMLFLKIGLDNGYSFRLATEMDAAEKFDDLVFEYKNGGGSVYRFLQAKHKQDERSIEVRDLLTEDKDGEFRLAKYFVSYRKIKKKSEFNGKNDEIKDFIICTNGVLSDDLQGSFKQIAAQDDLLDMSSESKYPKRLKLKIEKFPNKRELIAALKDASDINRLARKAY